MANTWESSFGMGQCGHISANRVGESFRRAMKEGLGDMHRLNSEAEDEEEADPAVMGVDLDQTENSTRDGCPVDEAVELVMARCSRGHQNSASPPKRFRPGRRCPRERGHVHPRYMRKANHSGYVPLRGKKNAGCSVSLGGVNRRRWPGSSNAEVIVVLDNVTETNGGIQSD